MKYNTLSFPIPLLLITYVSAISVHASLDVWRRQAIPSASECSGPCQQAATLAQNCSSSQASNSSDPVQCTCSVGFVDAAQGCYQCAVSHGTYTVDVANNTLQQLADGCASAGHPLPSIPSVTAPAALPTESSELPPVVVAPASSGTVFAPELFFTAIATLLCLSSFFT